MSYNVGVIIISDRAFKGERQDECLPVVKELLTPPDFNISHSIIVNDDPLKIKESLETLIAKECALVLTSGGTGCASRDNTPEVTLQLLDKPTPGVDEAIRRFSETKSKYAIYSRAVSGIARNTFIINLPGSPIAVREILEFIKPTLGHPLRLIAGKVKDCALENTRIK